MEFDRFRHIFLASEKKDRAETPGGMGGSLLTQWIAKYGYLPIVLIGMAGLVLAIGTRDWKTDDTIVVVADAPIVAGSFIERRPPTLEIKPEPKPSMELAALDPDTRLRDESDQPSSKGYILYANSPTNWKIGRAHV